jgi:DNA-binding NarL/FixJ family response regulator
VGRGLEAARRARSEPDDPDRAAALLTEAATMLRPAPLLAALAVRLAVPAVLADGAGEQVRDLLREAAGTLDRLALPRPADACRALLRDAGVAVPRRTSAQAGVPEPLRALGVTGRELEVLRLVAQGRTSREIAEQLYLSPRTVEKHVERLLTKTGAANRTALAGFAPAT